MVDHLYLLIRYYITLLYYYIYLPHTHTHTHIYIYISIYDFFSSTAFSKVTKFYRRNGYIISSSCPRLYCSSATPFWSFPSFFVCLAQAFCPHHFTAEVRVRFVNNLRMGCGRQSNTWTGFSVRTSIFPRQYHSTSAPHNASSATEAIQSQQLTTLLTL